VGTIAATGGQAMADQLNWQTRDPRKPNPQLKNRSSLRMSLPQQPLLDGQLEFPKVEPPSLEANQQLPSDRLINRTLRF